MSNNQYVRIRIWNETENAFEGFWIPINGNRQAIASLTRHLVTLKERSKEIGKDSIILGEFGEVITTEKEVDEYWVPIAGETKLEGELVIPTWTSPIQTEDALTNGGITKLMNPETAKSISLAELNTPTTITYTRFTIYNEKKRRHEGFWIPTKGNELAIEKLKRHLQTLDELVLENGTQTATREDIDNYWTPKLGDIKLLGWLHIPQWTTGYEIKNEIKNGKLPNLMLPTRPEPELPTTTLNVLADTIKTLTENVLTVLESLKTVTSYLEATQKETTNYINQHQYPTNNPETQDQPRP